jgi:hypothetical protein
MGGGSHGMETRCRLRQRKRYLASQISPLGAKLLASALCPLVSHAVQPSVDEHQPV